jgi:aldehyde dehydrogenase (NAD+)
VDKIQFDKIMGFLKEAKDEGLQILTGGERDGDVGYFVQPTVILNPRETARVMREEVFGPVQCVSTFNSEEDVLARANDTEFRLYASVFSKDITRALRVAKKFESGVVGVNVSSPYVSLDMPFGGWKQSGEGRELSKHGLDVWSELKSVFIAI